ncbi:MAG: hypothetical protein EA428_02540 [Spirochaetaceae bacterium]|nr:MAG: hypothetical protein EA428_02540 [Spirochaetaceae bacterium]
MYYYGQTVKPTRPLLAVLVFVLLLGSLTQAPAQQNPFFSAPRVESGPAPVPAESPGSYARFQVRLREYQRALHAQLAELMSGTEAGGALPGRSVALIGLVAFLYGLVHAALPGHRKILLASYFVAADAPLWQAPAAGVGVAVIHSGAAGVVVLGSYYLLQGSLSLALDQATVYLQGITAVIVMLIGVVVLTLKIREVHKLRQAVQTSEASDPDNAAGEGELEQRLFRRLRTRLGLLPAIVLSAVIPCPGSAMILLFSLSLGVLWLGLIATAAFSLGMAITLSLVSLVALLSKRMLTGVLDGRLGEGIHIGLESLGGLAMITVGLLGFLTVI